MHFSSFDLRDPSFSIQGFEISVQIVTLENLYGLDAGRTRLVTEPDAVALHASGLAFAGQQQRAEGSLHLRAELVEPGRLRIALRAQAPQPIRCLKLVLRDLPAPLELVGDEGAREVSPQGEIFAYPNRIPLPVFTVRAGGELYGARFEDTRVREKRFAIALERGAGSRRGWLEAIHEEDAAHFAREIEAPPLVLARGVPHQALVAEQLAFAEGALGLVPFEERSDVPAWARDLRLVLALHGMHWSGRVFLDYARMLELLRFACERIDGRYVLAYLPGWEGRYYWQYGDYRPEPALGGERGFAALCDGARALGAHVMPMFGANCANATLPRFRALDPAWHMKSATRSRFHGNQPDWDTARAHDTGWQAWLNPGHPGWRDELAGQIEALAGRFGFQGVFLDTIHVWTNDPDHPVHDGIRALVSRLRERIPELLLAAEHDYDALLPLFPWFQRAYWGRDPAWTARYARRFAHLCEGEPEGRTGVHELGHFTPRAGSEAPDRPRPGFIPTLTFQDDTLERSRERVEAAIAAARKG